MKRFFLAAALLVAGSALAQQGRELHWKTEMSGGPLPAGMSAETWVKGGKVRTILNTPMGPSVMVIKDKIVYVVTGGMGMKMSAEQGGKSPRPSDYAEGLEKILKDGKKIGMETIDGESCEKWKVDQVVEGKAVTSTLWISPSLKFPRQVTTRTEKGEILMKNKEIEKKVTLEDKLFEPDPAVKYMDMAEMMKGMQQGNK